MRVQGGIEVFKISRLLVFRVSVEQVFRLPATKTVFPRSDLGPTLGIGTSSPPPAIFLSLQVRFQGLGIFFESRCLCFATVGIRRMMTGAGEGRHPYLSCTIAPSLKSLWTIATSRSHRSFICSLSFCCASWLLPMLVEPVGEPSAAAPCSCILKEKPTRDVLAPARAGMGRRDLIEGRGGARKPDAPAMQASRRAHLRIIVPRRLCDHRIRLCFSNASSLAKRLARMWRSAVLYRRCCPPRCSACQCAGDLRP